MEKVTVEIPAHPEGVWAPPVLHGEPPEEKPQSAADVFFAQYVVCILLLTLLLVLRLYDEGAFVQVTETFRSRTAAPSEAWAEAAAAAVRSLWS